MASATSGEADEGDAGLSAEHGDVAPPATGKSTGRQRPSYHPDDREGIFETILVLDNRPVELEAHLERLRRSCLELYRREAPHETRPKILEAAAAGARGRLRADLLPRWGGDLALRIVARPLVEGLPGGLSAVWCRAPEGLWRHKFADRGFFSLEERRLPGGSTCVFSDDDGYLLEASRATVFLVEGEALVTRSLDGRVLPSVTRQVVIELAQAAGLTVRVEPIRVGRVAAADSVFTVNAVRGVQWVRSWARVRDWTAPDPLVEHVRDSLAARWRAQSTAPIAMGDAPEA